MKTYRPLAIGLLALGASMAPAIGQQSSSPDLAVTTAVIAAGGGAGAGSFSSVRAFSQMAGDAALQSELRSLRDRFGAQSVDRFVRAMDAAFIDGWRRAGQDDVKMPPASNDTGTALLLDMIRAGTGSDNVFRIGTMMDALWSSRVHAQIAQDLSAAHGAGAVQNFERVGNQFFYDLAHSLGDASVKPAPSSG